MRLSIAIVNWNTTELLGACVASIFRYAPQFDFEVIVVDNASSDFDEPHMRSRFPKARFMANSENLGYAKGNNQAIATSSGEYVLLLNPDTEFRDDSLTKLCEFMESHPDAAAAGCRLVRPTGSVDRSVRSFPDPGPVAWELLRLSKIFPKSKVFGAYRMTWFSYTEEAQVDQPMGSCLILSRVAINDVGVIDEDFPIFFNEVDWCYRAKQNGWKIYFTPSAEVVHHGGASTSQIRRAMRLESHRSLIRFYEKHYKKKLSPIVYWPIIGSIRLSQLFTRG